MQIKQECIKKMHFNRIKNKKSIKELLTQKYGNF